MGSDADLSGPWVGRVVAACGDARHRVGGQIVEAVAAVLQMISDDVDDAAIGLDAALHDQ